MPSLPWPQPHSHCTHLTSLSPLISPTPHLTHLSPLPSSRHSPVTLPLSPLPSPFFPHPSPHVHCSSISNVFMIISPISPLVVLLYFLLAYFIYPYVLINVIGAPQVDTAGEVWVQATTYQTAGLATSQVLLFGVTVFKASPGISLSPPSNFLQPSPTISAYSCLPSSPSTHAIFLPCHPPEFGSRFRPRRRFTLCDTLPRESDHRQVQGHMRRPLPAALHAPRPGAWLRHVIPRHVIACHVIARHVILAQPSRRWR